MKKALFLLFAITLFLSGNLFAQVNGEFRSVASGNWNSAATWQVYSTATASWNAAATFPNTITAVATVQTGHTLSLSAAATVLTLKLNGIVTTTATNLLTIYRNGSIVGGSNTAYIDGPIAAQVIGLGQQKILTLPVGKNNICRPVILQGTGTGTLATYTIEMFNAAPRAATLPATLMSVSNVRYYSIAKSPVSQNNNMTVQLSYDVDDAVGNYNSTVRVAFLGSAATGWADMGGSGTAPVTGTVRSTALITNAVVFGNGIYAIGSNLAQPSISGNAGVAGAVLAYNDGTPKTVTADATGNYTFKVPLDWTGTLTPSATGYTFTPASYSYSNVVVNKTAQNFSATSIYSDYRTLPDVLGNWNDPAMWEALNSSTSQWEPAINYPVNVTGTVTINNADLTINGALSISGTLINNGSLNLAANVTIAATGKLVNQGTLNNVAGGLKVYGTYEHAQDGGMIGIAGSFGESVTSFYTGSTLLITGVVSAAPTVPWWFSFPQMIWDCPNQTDDAFLFINSQNNNYGKDDYQGFGNLTVLNSNSHNIYMFSGQGRSVGNIVVDGPNSKLTAFTRSSNGIEYAFFSYFSSLTVQNGGQFYINTDPGSPGKDYATINIHNNLTVSSNSVLANYGSTYYSGPSYAKIVFTSNYPHTVDLSGQVSAPELDAQTNHFNFVVNGNTLTLASPISLNNLDLFGTGKIVSGGNLLTLLPGGAVSGASATSFTDGPVAFEVATTDPTSLVFPVGKGTVGRPVTLSLTQDAETPTTYTAEMLNPPVPTHALSPSLESVSALRYYTITKSVGANVTAASVTLIYSTDDGVGINNSILRIAKSDEAGNWIDLGGSGTAPTTGTITSTNNFTTFSDFALATGVVPTISGNAGIAGATITWMDGIEKTTTSDANGNYGILVPTGWSGTITPSLAGFAFTPANRAYSNVTAHQTAQNFTSAAILLTISGNAGVRGAILSYTDGVSKSVTADVNGNYSFTVSYNWSGTVTPSYPRFAFTPASIAYTNQLADAATQNYTAAMQPGVISYWHLDESGNSFSDDLGTNNGTGYLSPMAVTGQVSGAQQFNGTTTKIQVPASPTFDFAANGDFSVEFWYKGVNVPSGYKIAVGRYIPEGGAKYWYVGFVGGSGKIVFNMIGGGTGAQVYANSIFDGNWHHITAT
ncbi:MAG TPA: hypothetical protein VGK10_07915, partial [Prolixibacteraceae bacterium]